MLKQLKFKNDVIPGYFISDDGKIYDSNGVEQKQYMCSRRDYYFFKGHEVHQMMAHSFFGYKEGFVIHHKNQAKTDNRLENLVYLTRQGHTKLHSLGKKYCLGKKLSTEHKEKMSLARIGKKLSKETKEKIRAANQKQVYCVELNKIFAGVNIAARELSLSDSNICNCCKGKRKTCGGYHFEYYTGDQK